MTDRAAKKLKRDPSRGRIIRNDVLTPGADFVGFPCEAGDYVTVEFDTRRNVVIVRQHRKELP